MSSGAWTAFRFLRPVSDRSATEQPARGHGTELVRHRYRLDRIPDVLLRDRGIELMSARDVAAFLGVSTQRVCQVIREGRMPPASLTLGRTSDWEGEEITSWADVEW